MEQQEYLEIPPEKLQEMKDAFNMFDKNGDGHIDSKELGTVMRSLGGNPTNAEIQEMIKDVDINKNGVVEFNEFCVYMDKHMKCPNEEPQLLESFKVFDRNGNGRISIDELRFVMKNIGEPLSDEEIEEMFREADTDGSGDIDYGEYVKIMKH